MSTKEQVTGTVYDGLLSQIDQYERDHKAMTKEMERLRSTILKGSIEYQKIKSERDFLNECLDKSLAKVSTLKLHLSNFCDTWEARFDYNVQRNAADYSYEELQEYIEAATYLERFFERKNNRVREAEEMQESGSFNKKN